MAEITGLSFNQIKDMVLSSQFKFVVNEMSKGTPGKSRTFKNTMIRFLGTFQCSPGKIYHMTKAKMEKEENEKHNGIVQSED